jgi:hypothetical protein
MKKTHAILCERRVSVIQCRQTLSFCAGPE